MKLRRSRAVTSAIAWCCAVLGLSCGTPTAQSPPLLWQGVVVPVAGADDAPAGTVAMVSRGENTQIGIGLNDGTPAIEYGWLVREGSCAGEGARIGPFTAFRSITASASGSGDAEAVIRRRMSATTQYAADVFNGTNENGARVSCADLQRVE